MTGVSQRDRAQPPRVRGGVRSLYAGNARAVMLRGWRGDPQHQLARRASAGSSSRSSTCWRWASASARSSAPSRPRAGIEVPYAAFIAPGAARRRRR